MARRRKRQDANKPSASAGREEHVTPGLEPVDPAGVEGVAPGTDEARFAREAGMVGEKGQVGATTTGDEREIGRAGEGGLEGATGRDTTLGREQEAPLTGAASPGEAREKALEILGRRDVKRDIGRNAASEDEERKKKGAA